MISRPSENAAYKRLAVAGSVFGILGAKLWLIGTHGSATPFWDQWDAEAANLYIPYFSGELSLSHWIERHNEHRILLTRATSLGLLWLTGRWDTILQMIVNALVHAAAIGMLLMLLSSLLGRTHTVLLALFCLAIFSVPFGWENTLAGFQIQFYLLIALSIAAIALTGRGAAGSFRWWLGMLLGAACIFTVASGALTLWCCAAVTFIQLLLGRRWSTREWAGLALQIVIAAFLLVDALPAPAQSVHALLNAESISKLLLAVAVAAAWPFNTQLSQPAVQIGAAILLQAPALLFLLRLMWERKRLEDGHWLYLGLFGWFAAQTIALAYGRGALIMSPRYVDIFLVGVAGNCAAVLYLVGIAQRQAARPYLLSTFGALWLVAMSVGGGHRALNEVATSILERKTTAQTQTENVRQYLVTGDVAQLQGKSRLDIPHPSAERLQSVLGNTALRATLPATLTGRDEPRELATFKAHVLARGPMLLALGLGLLMAGLLFVPGRWSRPPAAETPVRS